MKLAWDQILSSAISFSKRRETRMSEGQSFVRDFLAVFGISDPATLGKFEKSAPRGSVPGRMDYLLPRQTGKG